MKNKLDQSQKHSSGQAELSPRLAPEGFSYIGITPCGCVVNAIVDSPEYKDEVAKALPKWIKSGLTIERVTHQQVRERYSPCVHAERQLNLNVPAR